MRQTDEIDICKEGRETGIHGSMYKMKKNSLHFRKRDPRIGGCNFTMKHVAATCCSVGNLFTSTASSGSNRNKIVSSGTDIVSSRTSTVSSGTSTASSKTSVACSGINRNKIVRSGTDIVSSRTDIVSSGTNSVKIVCSGTNKCQFRNKQLHNWQVVLTL